MRREVELSEKEKDKSTMLMEELAIYIETDALQYEMGNIVPKMTVSGNVTYDTLGTTLHKDRYTSLGMGLEYIFSLEDTNRDQSRNNVDFCIGGSYNW